jgi:ribosomal protein L37AE/L43A
MPCYRCGARQVDPDRGESPWKRGVRADRQVLICPTCQSSSDWMAELDRCPVCMSTHLVRRLGEVECRDCGYVRDPGGAGPVTGVPTGTAVPGAGSPGEGSRRPEPDFGETPGLAEEVELALARVLGRAGRPARIG